LSEAAEQHNTIQSIPLLRDDVALLHGLFSDVIDRLTASASVVGDVVDEDLVKEIERASMSLRSQRKKRRPELLSLSAEGILTPDAAEAGLIAVRWLDRIAYHAWRAALYIDRTHRVEPLEAGHDLEMDADEHAG